MSFKEAYAKWNSINLVARIVGGLLIGLVLALIIPGLPGIPLLGTVFVGALKAFAPILVFFLVIGSLSKSKNNLGKQFRTVIILYLVGTILASLIAVSLSFTFPVTVTLSDIAEGSGTTSIETLIETLLINCVTNPVSSLANGNYLGILVWSIIIGLVMKAVARPSTIELFDDFSNIVTSVIKIIISIAPFGILGIVYDAVSTNGIEIFVDYGKLLLLLVGSMLIVALILNPILVFITTHKNPYPLIFQTLKESAITAFFTRSSAANIPVNMALCEKLKLNKDFYSVSIPLGATINMSGAAITIAVMTLAAVNTLGIQVPIGLAVLLCIISAVGACGASGVAGGSLLLIPLACSLFGISNDIAMQMVAIGFIIGVIQDSFETALNSSSDVVFTAAADMRAQKLAKNADESPAE